MKKPFRYFVCLLLLSALLVLHAGALAGDALNTTVRVWLKRLGVEDTIRITVQGTYMLDDGSMTFSDGAELAVVLRGEHLVLHADKLAIVMGDRMILRRCSGEMSGSLLLEGSDSLYEGDLFLTIQNEKIMPVLHIGIEDYVMGVVPYEMGDSFPLEALKAQAVAARSYALMRTGSAGAYDVEDTTNDQAFKGKSLSSERSMQAVSETEGLYGMYNGKVANCNYSASNGGQTELGRHVWPSNDPQLYAHMDMRDDPYDYENDASVVKRYTLSKKPGETGVGTALHSVIVTALSEQLESMGYEADEHLLRIDEVLAAELTEPKFDPPSRLMTQLNLKLRLSCRSYTFRDKSGSGEHALEKAPDVPDAQTTPSPTPRPTATPAYSPFVQIDHIFEAKIPLFPDAEKAMGLSINLYQNELITMEDIGTAFMFESRRYGHGVGLSQRGAQQMAGKYGMTFDQILAFYYPGMTIASLDATRKPLAVVDMNVMATPAPTPSPTPRPTLMPVTEKLPRGAYYAVVSNIADDSSLNLREHPSLSAKVLRRLYKNQKLIVLKETADGWSHVKTDVIEGYVRSEYLQTAE